jgi:L-alanine-DL-glutamate epimerase-like enolase superfamily enzyme
VFEVQMQMDGGSMFPSEAPGLGLEVDLDALRRRQAPYRPVPRLSRPDGAFTNW